MYIKEVEINNFRIYKGNNKISISPESEGDKNIIVISGKNGYGKTTFLMSLVWCLYGKQMELVDELYAKEIKDKKNYSNYIANSLNRKAAENGETQFSVSLTFTDVKIPEITTCKEVKITRKYDVITSSLDQVEVLIDGMHNEITDDLSKDNQKGEEIFIREYVLPIEIAKFFFFDAEKIVSLAEVNSQLQRKQLSKAYSEVLGIQKYEDLKANLEEKQDDYRKLSAKPEEQDELIQLKANIEKTERAITRIDKQIEELDHEKNGLEKEVEEVQRKLIREGERMTLEELNMLRDQKSELEQKIDGLQTQLRDLFDLIPFALAGETMMNVSEQLSTEKNIHDQQYKEDELKDKTRKIILDIETERTKKQLVFDHEIRNFYEDQIKNLIKKHFFSDLPEIPINFQSFHDFSNIEINEFNQLLATLQNSFRDSFSRLNNDYAFIKNQLDSINRRIRDAEKSAEDEYIGELRRKKQRQSERIDSIDTEINLLHQSIGEKKNESKAFKQRQEALRQKIDNSTQYSLKASQTKTLIDDLQEFISKFKEQKKKSLEEKMLKGLTTLMHKKGFITKVEVDISILGDDIDIILYDHRNRIIDKGTLSMGERQMYASALLHALVDESDIDFPVFIDSPMQKFDEKHAENIIKYFYPNVSNQVVIFPLINKELTAQEFESLKVKICRSFIIHNTSTDSSEFLEVKPDDFLQTYNELYNAN
ncbi:DNA sulfur modification protein DndD [Gaoshiqia sp. Z1-71]|uniref:DNA sulfur modification protein DndD n=1 Tax=Gaoshiqia hydrogeniformans TaxID=3290090 RepID=UPI003BF7BB75